MKAADILKATGGKLVKGSPDTSIETFSIDSRMLKRGDLFIAIKGNNFDGHDFAGVALKKGAIGVIVSHESRITNHESRLIIQVKNTRRALGAIAHYKRKHSRAKVIAITGSNGKTTTKDMIASILGEKFKVLSTPGTENNSVGVPLTLLRLKDEDFCVLEMGMNDFGEIDYLASIALPEIGVITNIGPSHLEGLKDTDGVFKAKMELLKHMDEGAILIINGDDKYLSTINLKSFRIIRFGLDEANDIYANSIAIEKEMPVFRVNGKYEIRLNLFGRHNIYNALAAVSVAGACGIGEKSIKAALENFKGLYGRLELKEIDGIIIIDDAYNSNPVSLKNALEVLKDFETDGRKILVTGDMLELGKMSKYFHEAIVETIDAAGIDMLITVGEHSYNTFITAKKRGMNKDTLWHFDKPHKAGELLKEIAKRGDTILLKGSRGIKMEEALRCFTTSSTR